jgi:leader peptidase (prepilin peptidase)/N-methyltransferase
MLNLAGQLPLLVWTAWTFVLGACVGSLLNVVIARIPLEKSILWPGSRCGACLQPIRMTDNIPLLSYWLLRGRCRLCGARFSMQYFLVELLTAAVFAAVFWFEVVTDVRGSDVIRENLWHVRNGLPPWPIWVVLLQRWTLLAFLIAITGCDLLRREIPLSITMTGTIIGLAFSTFCPWPWPEPVAAIPQTVPPWWQLASNVVLPTGAQLWPAWEGVGFGSSSGGFVNGLIGMATGTLLLRGVRTAASWGLGREALGLGDADLMMMVGAFLGWQAVVVAFFAGALAALVLAVIQVAVFRDDSLPFGPGLAVGTVLTWLTWPGLGTAVRPLFFNFELLLFVGGAGAGLLFVLCWVMGKARPAPVQPPP